MMRDPIASHASFESTIEVRNRLPSPYSTSATVECRDLRTRIAMSSQSAASLPSLLRTDLKCRRDLAPEWRLFSTVNPILSAVGYNTTTSISPQMAWRQLLEHHSGKNFRKEGNGRATTCRGRSGPASDRAGTNRNVPFER
jgi:hypothetical protein